MKKLDYKTEIIIGLQDQGYCFDFILQHEFLKCIQDGALISPDDFEIEEAYILQGSNTSQSPHLIYAINSLHNGIKGIMMLPYSKFIKGMSIHLWTKFATQLKYAAHIISCDHEHAVPKMLPISIGNVMQSKLDFAYKPKFIGEKHFQRFNFSIN